MPQTVPGIPQLLVSLHPDAVISSRYTLKGLIDEGGCGQVWLAMDAVTNKQVAIKFPRVDQGSDQRERFASELQILKLLPHHPHLVQLLDEGVFEGQQFLVMEYFPKTLSAWLNEHRAMRQLPALFTVYRLFAQICDAVAAAHRLPVPIIHRDINPRNIMLSEDARGELSAKVLDFGIGRIGKRQHTQTGECIGTPGYMSPEQMNGDAADVGTGSDVYSLGILAFEMLCLEHPSTADTAPRSDVPRLLWDVIATATHPRISQRYNDAQALRTAWGNCIAFAYEQSVAQGVPTLRETTHLRPNVEVSSSNGVVAFQQEEQETQPTAVQNTKITARPLAEEPVTVRSSSNPRLPWDIQKMRHWWNRLRRA